MTDVIIDAIRNSQIRPDNICFAGLRELAGRDLGCWSELGRGRSILSTYNQLDQYLYSYGLMTRAQWAVLLPNVSLSNGPFSLVDYGCGQGLGSAIVFDYFDAKLRLDVQNVVLIEPSGVALARAEEIVRCYCPGSEISSVNKTLDDLSDTDIQSCRGLHSIHIFSNVLDIDGFEYAGLFNKMFSIKGLHTVLAVSHDRNFAGGSDRFHDIEEQIKDEEHHKWFSLKSSEIIKFSVDDKPMIAWQLHLEVLDGFV